MINAAAAANRDGGGDDVRVEFRHDMHERLLTAFHEVDRDEDAALDRAELQELWTKIFPDLSTQEVKKITDDIFKDLDPNQDNEVSLGELRNYLLNEGQEKTEIDQLLDDEVIVSGGPQTLADIVWSVVELDAPHYMDSPRWLRPARIIAMLASQVMILISVVVMIIESMPMMQNRDSEAGNTVTFVIEATCIGFFTVEFILRAWANPCYRIFWKQFFTWVDILAVLPFYMSIAFEGNPTGALVILRVLRLLRLLRVLKLGRQFLAVQLMVIAIARCIQPMLVLMIGVNLITITLSGSMMWTLDLADASFNFTEKVWYRNRDSEFLDAGKPIYFQSIPDAIWWSLCTITTVGYGDTFPYTHMGKVVASLTMIVGLILLAFPLTLISSAFSEVAVEMAEKKCMYERRKAFRHHIAKASSLQLRKPMVLLEPDDFAKGMPVMHRKKKLGTVTKVNRVDGVVHIKYTGGKKAGCKPAILRTHRYAASSLATGKIRSLYGICDFEEGMPVEHSSRGKGVVTCLDGARVHVRYDDNGETHKYKQASLAKAKLVPLRQCTQQPKPEDDDTEEAEPGATAHEDGEMVLRGIFCREATKARKASPDAGQAASQGSQLAFRVEQSYNDDDGGSDRDAHSGDNGRAHTVAAPGLDPVAPADGAAAQRPVPEPLSAPLLAVSASGQDDRLSADQSRSRADHWAKSPDVRPLDTSRQSPDLNPMTVSANSRDRSPTGATGGSLGGSGRRSPRHGPRTLRTLEDTVLELHSGTHKRLDGLTVRVTQLTDAIVRMERMLGSVARTPPPSVAASVSLLPLAGSATSPQLPPPAPTPAPAPAPQPAAALVITSPPPSAAGERRGSLPLLPAPRPVLDAGDLSREGGGYDDAQARREGMSGAMTLDERNATAVSGELGDPTGEPFED